MATQKKSSDTQQSLRITLKRSPIGTPQKHRLVLRGLGLRKLNATVLRPATDQVKGMIAKVGYLLEVSPQ
ncbi:MAG: 50S ribosomal protein L30 [Nitrospira sp.]|nr:50S ribosomal protein L30 [Nitrospira sp.]